MFNSTFGAGGGVLANDTDVEGDLLLGATLVDGPANGDPDFNGDGTFTYTPNPNFHGTDRSPTGPTTAGPTATWPRSPSPSRRSTTPRWPATARAATDEDTALTAP